MDEDPGGRHGRDFDAADTLTDRAYRELEEEIVTLRIPPGAMVSEVQLSKRLGVGRTPVREALQRLARERLVNILPRRGIVVTEIDVVAQLRLLEVRRVVERLLAESAARRASRAEREAFRAIASGMEAAADSADDLVFMRLDRAFNLLLLDASGNEFAAGAMGLMNGLSRRFWYLRYREAGDLAAMARLHAAVATAVAEGDAAGAGAASDKLVGYIRAFARSTIG